MRKNFFTVSVGILSAAILGVVFGLRPVSALFSVTVGVVVWLVCRLAPPLCDRGIHRFVLCFFCGFCAMSLYFLVFTGFLSSRSEIYDGSSGIFEFRTEDFSEDGQTVAARILTDGKPSPYLVSLSSYDRLPELSPGSEFRVGAALRAPENTERFRSESYFRSENIYLTGYLTDEPQLLKNGSLTIFNWHKYVRHGALSRCAELFGENSYLMSGLLFGDKSGFTDSFTSAASNAGVSHIFSVSGMHLSFCVSAVLLLGRRRRTHIAAIFVVIIFMAVTGFEPSVVRSGVMQIAALTSWILGRDGDSFSAMAFSLILLLILNPCCAADIGLQFSFSSVAGILLTGEKLKKILSSPAEKLSSPILRRVVRTAAEAVSVSLSASLFTLPLTVLYFEKLSLVSVISNIFMMWLVSAVFLLGMLSLILSCLWLPIGSVAAFPTNLGADILEFAINGFSNLPFAVLGTAAPAVKLSLLASYCTGALFFAGKSGRAFLKTVAFTLISVCLALVFGAVLRAGELRVSAVDVGYGSCTLLCRGKTVVAVDCFSGGTGSAAALTDKLQRENIRKLDLFIVTNMTSFANSGADELIESGKIKRLALATYSGDREDAEKLISLAQKHGVPVEVVSADCEYALGEMRITVFVPLSSGESRGTAAVLCEYGGASVFIPGVTGDEAQNRLLATRKIPDINLLFAGKSGVKGGTSQKLVSLAEDGFLIISGNEGKNTPDPELLTFAKRFNLRTFHTASCGDIDFIFRKGRIYIND